MTEDKPGLLMVWTDIPPEVEPGFNEWYNREHMPDRINKVPGFTRGRRFVAIDGSPRYLALYETRSAQVFRSAPYLAINKDPDPTSRRFIPLFKNTIKGICDTTLRIGQGEGGYLALLPASSEAHSEDNFSAWVCTALLPDIAAAGGVVAATFAQRNRKIQDIAAASYTRSGDRFVDSIIAIEAASEGGLTRAVAALSAKTLEQHGGRASLFDRACTFRTIYTLHA
jgi:hypothetical protein